MDYRTDDNKEGTFEVSLFAELFNEMMTRDSAFKIYEALVNAPDKVKESKKKEEKKEDKKDEKPAEEKSEEKSDDKMDTEEVAKEDNSQKSDAPTEEKSEENRETSVEITEEKKEKILVTKNKKLLSGFSFFDQSHCGYLENKDIEDILLTLELDLSRAEIKKISNKLASKDQVNYRHLVDGELDANSDEATTEEETDHQSLVTLAKGFRQYLPGKCNILLFLFLTINNISHYEYFQKVIMTTVVQLMMEK